MDRNWWLKIAGFTRFEISSFIAAMKRTLVKNSRKGDSWKTCPIDYLRSKLIEEVDEFIYSTNDEQALYELTDIANICLMLHQRILKDGYRTGKR